MRLATIRQNGKELGAVLVSNGVITLDALNKEKRFNLATDLLSLIREQQLPELNKWYRAEGKCELEKMTSAVIPFEKVVYAPLYRHPKKIFGIGLNYADHAGDLAEKTPQGIPASFFKPETSIVGYGDNIKIPLQSQKTTGEAELGIIIGKECENIEAKDWLRYIAGFTTIIDMTAEDILRLNPRYLTYVKSFETFFSFGPQLITTDEIKNLSGLKVQTVHNGEVYAENTVSSMTFPPDFLVAFHSKVFKWQPGDILSTGTPRAVQIVHGDTIECRITGFEPLVNPVIDKKIKK